MGMEQRRQRERIMLARKFGAHYVSVTAHKGYARFASPNMAEAFSSQLDDVNVYVYGQGPKQTAVDWTVTNRYADGKVVR